MMPGIIRALSKIRAAFKHQPEDSYPEDTWVNDRYSQQMPPTVKSVATKESLDCRSSL